MLVARKPFEEAFRRRAEQHEDQAKLVAVVVVVAVHTWWHDRESEFYSHYKYRRVSFTATTTIKATSCVRERE